jgi:hypothetical protein
MLLMMQKICKCKLHLFLCRGRIQRKPWCMRPYDGADYYLLLCPLQSRPQHIYYGQPYARVDLNTVPESTLSPIQGLWIWPQFIPLIWLGRAELLIATSYCAVVMRTCSRDVSIVCKFSAKLPQFE